MEQNKCPQMDIFLNQIQANLRTTIMEYFTACKRSIYFLLQVLELGL